MSSAVYQIFNSLTMKSYVGSSVNVERRWREHKRDLRRKKHSSIKFQNSWNFHGPDVWIWKILQNGKKDQLPWLEALWMAKLDSVDNGYNVTKITIEGNRVIRTFSEITREKLKIAGSKQVVTEETRKKMSESGKLRVASEETRRKMSESKRNISEETRRKMSTSSKGRRHSTESRKKISDSRKKMDCKPTEEVRKRISESMKLYRMKEKSKLTLLEEV